MDARACAVQIFHKTDQAGLLFGLLLLFFIMMRWFGGSLYIQFTK